MLEIDNNDVIGIEQFGSPERLNFWDVIGNLSVEELFPWIEGDEAVELTNLVKDHDRVLKQKIDLERLMPKNAEKIAIDFSNAEAKIEKAIKRILKKHIHFEDSRKL